MTSRGELGRRAEDVAARYLEELGYKLVARNVRVGRFEIDLVARDGDLVAVVEVRTRGEGSWKRALDSIDARKRARLRLAGQRLWREQFRSDPSCSRLRFDAVTVTFEGERAKAVEHVRAFLTLDDELERR